MSNSQVIWSAETGWTDDGPRATTTLDESGRLVIIVEAV